MTENNAAQPGLTDELSIAINMLISDAKALAHVKAKGYDASDAERCFQVAQDRLCTLLSKLRAEGVQAGDERAAFEAHMKEKFGGLVEPWDARRGRYGFGPDNTRWEGWHDRAALASAPVAGKAVACLRRQRNGSDWGHWVPGTVQDGQRVTGLRTWQVRWLVDAAPQASEAVRNAALEEAAALCEAKAIDTPRLNETASIVRGALFMQAELIRAMKTQADKDGGDCAKGAGDV